MITAQSTIVAIACLYLIMGLAGCTSVSTEAVKKALEKRKQEPCQCEQTQSPVTIIFVED
jgi:hypothetical protein